jgi:orotate phosphoribosyltransferase
LIADYRVGLLRILAQKSFRFCDTKLSAGSSSDYYIDCRTTTLSGDGGRLAGLAILDLFREKHLSPHAIGGLTLGADPVVSNVTAASAWRVAKSGGRTAIDGFLVRKEAKVHGTGRRIEGFCEPDAPVVIVDDACTTGRSIVTAIRAAQEARMLVIGVVCLVEREEAGGRPTVEAAALGAPFYSIFSALEVRDQYLAAINSRKQPGPHESGASSRPRL